MKKLLLALLLLVPSIALAVDDGVTISGGNVSLGGSSKNVTLETSGSGTKIEALVNNNLVLGFDANGISSNVDIGTTGKTLVLEDGTAASSCIGTGTLTAATAVQVATTCIETGDYVFVTRTSDDTDGTGNMWVDNIVDGTYFEVTSETSDTATFNWVIIKGQ